MKNELEIRSLREFDPFRNLMPTAMGVENEELKMTDELKI
jgi:hypothetical protein